MGQSLSEALGILHEGTVALQGAHSLSTFEEYVIYSIYFQSLSIDD